MNDIIETLEAELYEIVLNAIRQMGIDEFKKTSFFMSNKAYESDIIDEE